MGIKVRHLVWVFVGLIWLVGTELSANQVEWDSFIVINQRVDNHLYYGFTQCNRAYNSGKLSKANFLLISRYAKTVLRASELYNNIINLRLELQTCKDCKNSCCEKHNHLYCKDTPQLFRNIESMFLGTLNDCLYLFDTKLLEFNLECLTDNIEHFTKKGA